MTTAEPTIGALAAAYADGRLARGEITKDTCRHIRSRLGGLVSVAGDMPVAELDWPVIDRWQRSIGKLSPSTRRSYLSTIRVFCQWLVIDGHVSADPTGRSAAVHEPRRIPRAQPAEAIAKLLAIAPDARALLVVWLMVGIGLRRCEVARLNVHDWDPVAQTMAVRGKGDHERLLPLPTEVTTALHAHVAIAGWQAGPLIRIRDKAVTPEQVSALVAKMMLAAGLKRGPWDGVSAHALRHTCASDVLDHCHDIRTVQELLGHASIATTQIYTRRADLDKLRAAMGGRPYGSAA